MDVFASLRLILSALKIPAYKLVKLIVPNVSPITINEYSVKDSFHFSSEILEQDSSLFMGSLHVHCTKNEGLH